MKPLYIRFALLAALLSSTVALKANSNVQGPDNKQSVHISKQETFKPVNQDEIQMQKIAYYSQQLQLTTEEAQLFWPLYNEYWAECGKARKKTIEALRALNEATAPESKATDSEIQRLAQEYFSNYRAESDLPAKYFEKFAKILPVKKAAKVFHTEEKFRRILIKQFRNQPHNGQKGN